MGQRVEGGEGAGGRRGKVPSEYNRSCMSGCVVSSHSRHFFAVAPNSQY